MKCEIPAHNPDDGRIKTLLEGAHTLAVIGLSGNPEKTSHEVAQYMQEKGFRIIPVNPGYQEILGEKSWPDCASIPDSVDIVVIFRKPEALPGAVDDALSLQPKAVWMQLGLCHNASASRCESQGVACVQSRCIKVEYARLFT